MHKSKLAGFIVDCQTQDVDAAAAFWSAALGMPTQTLSPEESGQYVRLMDPSGQLHIEVQAVAHTSRVHLDIETDDIEAEVRRLEGHGAKVAQRLKSWVVMEAPTGQRFCVVRAHSDSFASLANTWT